ncbi:GyrI-like domain-containing protein [Carnobacterium divergens]|uniref:GyrI-like domain-containing protein n=1 Tax=Carnobacterium divergens TaxID=2748 RepID=UPI0039B01A3A
MSKTIHGLKIRTNNQQLHPILDLWSLVPNMELKGAIYAVYFNYESDFTGDYDLLVGNETAPFKEQVLLSEGNYLEIPVKTLTPAGVGEAWQKIWRDTKINQVRTYQTDFEYYAEDGSIKIFLSI